VRNNPKKHQASVTNLDFVMGFRDPPRRFPMPIPTHEERWGAYRLDAIYENNTPIVSDMLGRFHLSVNTKSPTDLSLATQALEVNNTV
jgi:hypothetical protein